MRAWREFLIVWMGWHGRAHTKSRHVGLKQLLSMGL